MTREIRTFAQPLKLEVRGDDQKNITGYAAVFDSDSVDFMFFREVIRKGAFARTLREQGDVRALLDHDTGKIIARTKAGNLSLSEDDIGLRVEIEPINTEDGHKALEWIRSGVVDGMSFGFETRTDRWSTKDGKSYRELLDVELYEVSLVAFPAYPGTHVDVRSATQVWEEHRQSSSRQVSRFKNRLRILNLHG